VNPHVDVRTYLKILAIVAAISFISGYASAESPLYNQGARVQRDMQQYQEQEAVRNQMQRRMNQQYYNERLGDVIQQQQDTMHYNQHQEHMRNQGWGRPGLDGGRP
jgi:hypothetical protein